MKKLSYIFGLVLFIGTTLFVFEKDGYSVTRTSAKRTSSASTKRAANTSAKRASSKTSSASTKRAAVSSASTKRAATSSASTKRAATSSASTKRAATNTSASTKRMMSRSAPKRVATTTTSTTSTTSSNEKICPFGDIIKIEFDEADPTLVKNVSYRNNSKTESCVLPDLETTDYVKWETSKISSYPGKLAISPKWVAVADAYYLECRNGYVENEVDGKTMCVPYSDVCPLNEPIENRDGGYINPRTLESCQKLKNSLIKELSYEEYERDYYNDYAYDDISIFECPANWYSVNSNMVSGLSVECKACPYTDKTGKKLYSPKGSTELAACRPACEKDPETKKERISIKEGDSYVCKVCADGAKFNISERTCDTQPGYTCWENGTRCEKTLTTADCATGFVSIDKEHNKCVCPEGWLGDGLKSGEGCIRPCGANATLQEDNSCKCNEGYTGDVYNGCTLIPNLTAADCIEGATFENGLCNCPEGTFGDGLKDNKTSPYCKIMGETDPVCKNTYANGIGTKIPRGCIATCQTGFYWGER